MKSKSDLKRKVLCSLLAASTMGIFYSNDALAAQVNGKPVEGTITDQTIIENGSGKFVIGQGNLDIQTDANVNIMIGKLKDKLDEAVADNKITAEEAAKALQAFVGVYGEGQVPLTGVVGGEGQLDSGTLGLLENLRDGDITTNPLFGQIIDNIVKIDVDGVAGKLANINTITQKDIEGNIIYNVGGEKTSPVIIGAIGGDLSLNAGLNGSLNASIGSYLEQNGEFTSEETSINRKGSVNITINNGNVLVGVGGSAAISAGNIKISGNLSLTDCIGANIDMSIDV